jgi:hypothetical protein
MGAFLKPKPTGGFFANLPRYSTKPGLRMTSMCDVGKY